MTSLTQEQAMRLLFSNRQLTIESLLEIEDKSRQLVPYILNPIQSDMLNNSFWRDIYVKPAQVGATSLHEADFYIDNITINGTVSVIISYDELSAQRLLLKAKKFHRSLERRIPSIPKLDHKSSTELTWDNKDTNFYSAMYIFSARSYTLGRGEAIHNLLLDEFGFWPLGTHEAVFASAVQRVPLKAGTKVRVQSTANGEANPHCEMYRAAKEGTAVSGSVYRPHFYPWHMHPEYVMYPDDVFCMSGDELDILPNLSSDEILLMRLFVETLGFDENLAMAKLRWRRYKWAEMASLYRTGETVLLASQEYPGDDESCFISAGGQAYNTDIINTKIRECYPAPQSMNLVNEKTGVAANLEIWHNKEEGRGYVIGIDPGKGKISESVAHVWTFIEGYRGNDGVDVPPDMKHCATLAGFYDEWEMAIYCKQIGYYYNNALLAPEDNLDIVSHLRDYPDIYMREDLRSGKLQKIFGWQSNVNTKPYMITEVSRHMEYLDCHDIRFWSQCKNIRRDAESRSGISVVGADDHHDSGAIAIVCRDAQPIQRGYIGSAGWAEDWGR